MGKLNLNKVISKKTILTTILTTLIVVATIIGIVAAINASTSITPFSISMTNPIGTNSVNVITSGSTTYFCVDHGTSLSGGATFNARYDLKNDSDFATYTAHTKGTTNKNKLLWAMDAMGAIMEKHCSDSDIDTKIKNLTSNERYEVAQTIFWKYSNGSSATFSGNMKNIYDFFTKAANDVDFKNNDYKDTAFDKSAAKAENDPDVASGKYYFFGPYKISNDNPSVKITGKTIKVGSDTIAKANYSVVDSDKKVVSGGDIPFDEKFYIRIKATEMAQHEGDFKLEIGYSYYDATNYYVYFNSSNPSSQQHITSGNWGLHEKTFTSTLKVPKDYGIKFIKQGENSDARADGVFKLTSNGKDLSDAKVTGAKSYSYNAADSSITFTSGTSEIKISELEPGTYTITEVTPPSGFSKTTSTVKYVVPDEASSTMDNGIYYTGQKVMKDTAQYRLKVQKQLNDNGTPKDLALARSKI